MTQVVQQNVCECVDLLFCFVQGSLFVDCSSLQISDENGRARLYFVHGLVVRAVWGWLWLDFGKGLRVADDFVGEGSVEPGDEVVLVVLRGA